VLQEGPVCATGLVLRPPALTCGTFAHGTFDSTLRLPVNQNLSENFGV
jgi:hypothetical protein